MWRINSDRIYCDDENTSTLRKSFIPRTPCLLTPYGIRRNDATPSHIHLTYLQRNTARTVSPSGDRFDQNCCSSAVRMEFLACACPVFRFRIAP